MISSTISDFYKPYTKEICLAIFKDYCMSKIGITSNPTIEFTEDKSLTPTYGHFDPNSNSILIYTRGRGFADVLRTLAHELVHVRQHELGQIDHNSGKTGSPIENTANAVAGVIMRLYGKDYPLIYEL